MFTFGKHVGKSFEQVATSDANYCRWVLTIEGPRGGLADFQNFLKARDGNAPAAPGPVRIALCSQRPTAPGVSTATTDTTGTAAQPPPNTVFVLELMSKERFTLRAEQLDPESSSCNGQTAWLPKPLWLEIGTWPGQQLSGDRWSFPVENHAEVVSRLANRGFRYEAVPDFALKLLTAAPLASTKPSTAASSTDSEVATQQLAARLPSMLMPYQHEGVLFGHLQAHGRVLIGDEMGLGKTLQALVLASLYTEDWPVLVVCPSSVRFVWKEQAERWLPELCSSNRVQVVTKGKVDFRPDAAIWVISYHLLADGRTRAKFMTRPGGDPHRVVICDESHNIKEWKAKRTQATVRILEGSTRSILLSGTPTRNTPDELHPQLTGLKLSGVGQKPGQFGYSAFCRRYCIERLVRLGSGKVIKKITGARNATELNLVLNSSIMIRRKKKDVLHELPPLRRQKVPIELAHSKSLTDIQSAMKAVEEGEAQWSQLFAQLAEIKLPFVLEYITDALDRGDEKFIVFAHHYAMLDGIEEALKKKLVADKSRHVRIDGRTPSEKRLALVNCFQEDPRCRVAVLSITACAEGLTFTAAGLVIFAELYWVPGTVEQAEARAHRMGTKHMAVVVEFLLVSNSPDELIYKKLQRKKRDTSNVLDNEEGNWNAEVKKARTMKGQRSSMSQLSCVDGALTIDLDSTSATAQPARGDLRTFFKKPSKAHRVVKNASDDGTFRRTVKA